MSKTHKLIIVAGLLLSPTSALAGGFFTAPGRFGSVGQSQDLCIKSLLNNPFSQFQPIPCFAGAVD